MSGNPRFAPNADLRLKLKFNRGRAVNPNQLPIFAEGYPSNQRGSLQGPGFVQYVEDNSNNWYDGNGHQQPRHGFSSMREQPIHFQHQSAMATHKYFNGTFRFHCDNGPGPRAPMHRQAMSVREPNDDFQTNAALYTRRGDFNEQQQAMGQNNWCGPQMPMHKYVQGHQNQNPNPKPHRLQRDPRVNRCFNHLVKVEINENSEMRDSCTINCCKHPRVNVFEERKISQTTRTTINVAEASNSSVISIKPPPTNHLNRIEREKYERAKNSRNLLKGERAVDIVNIPRPPRNEDMESQINTFIEQTKAPEIKSTPNFTNYKIPKATKGDPKPATDEGQEAPCVTVEPPVTIAQSSDAAPKPKGNKSKTKGAKKSSSSTEQNKQHFEKSMTVSKVAYNVKETPDETSKPASTGKDNLSKRDSLKEINFNHKPQVVIESLPNIESYKKTKNRVNSTESTPAKDTAKTKSKRKRLIISSDSESDDQLFVPDVPKSSPKPVADKTSSGGSSRRSRSRTTVSEKHYGKQASPEKCHGRRSSKRSRSTAVSPQSTTGHKYMEEAKKRSDDNSKSRKKKRSSSTSDGRDLLEQNMAKLMEESVSSTECSAPKSGDLTQKLVSPVKDDGVPDPADLLKRLLNTDPEILKQINCLLQGGIAMAQSPTPASPSVSHMATPPIPIPSRVLNTVPLPKAQSPTISSNIRIDEFALPTSIDNALSNQLNPIVNVQRLHEPSPPPTKMRPRSESCGGPIILKINSRLAIDRASPRLRKNRKNELEQLQEDISRNYNLNFIMSDRTVKQPKEVATKKIERRRKSMCSSSLSTENGAIKLTITREPKVKDIRKRRMSVGCVQNVVPDDIRNDDHLYDLDSGNCRLCNMSSTEMDAHYIENHRDSEVFCCRIKFHVAFKLKRGENCNVTVDVDSKDYVCILCNKIQTCTTYYSLFEHFASHTGEFYFKCTLCNFHDVSYNNEHARLHQNKFEIYPYSEIKDNQLRAYMCDKCNFVQLQKTNINKHILCHHRDLHHKPKIREFVLLNFGDLKLAPLDFEDFDDRFKCLPMIEEEQKPVCPLEEELPDLDAEVSEYEDAEEDGALKRFEKKLVRISKILPIKAPAPPGRSGIRIENITYYPAESTFELKGENSCIEFTSYLKLEKFLEELTGAGDMWTGFCVSCDPKQSYGDPLPAIKELVHLRNVHWHQTTNRAVNVADKSILKTTNRLRPWLSKREKKTTEEAQKLLSLPAILAAFKCMAPNCIFFTNRMDKMKIHLDQHDSQFEEAARSPIECAYCDAEFTTSADLIDHVVTSHEASQYYCPYCFFRSNSANVKIHLTVYHGGRNPYLLDGKYDGIFQCSRNKNDYLYNKIQINVKPNTCPECGDKFFPADSFQEHLETHGPEYFCEDCCTLVPVVQFLPHSNSHKRGPFECIHCSFGTIDGPSVKRHLMDHHSNEAAFVCVRLFRGDLESSFEALESIRLCNLGSDGELSRLIKVVPKDVFDDIDRESRDIVISNVQGGIEEGVSKKTLNSFILDLPDDYVFSREIKCPQCDFSTRIRRSLIQHFSQHSEPGPSKPRSTYPVNETAPTCYTSPKATAPLSRPDHTTPTSSSAKLKRRRMTICVEHSMQNVVEPQYVSLAQRFRCGLDGCDYCTHDERTLQAHILGIHENDRVFKCPHCETVLRGWDDFEIIFSHYKLHDTQLFKCALCTDFYGESRQAVSKHIRKRHSVTVNDMDIVTIRGNSERTVVQKPKKATLQRRHSMAAKRSRLDLFRCADCSFEEMEEKVMLVHIKEVHGYSSQMQCSLCKFVVVTTRGFKIHAALKHPGKHAHILTRFRSVYYFEEDPSTSSPQLTAALVPAILEAPAVIQPRVLQTSNSFEQFRHHYKNNPILRAAQYYCGLCPQTFETEGRTSKHYTECHQETFNPQLPAYLLYCCLFCEFTTPRTATLADHFVRNHDRMSPMYKLEYIVKCTQCEYANTAENVQKRCSESHPGNPVVLRKIFGNQCGLCSFNTVNDDLLLQQHFLVSHKIIINPKLNDEKNFKNLLNLKVEKLYECRECKISLTHSKVRFHPHISKCIEAELAHRYRCPICSLFALNYEEAKAHMRHHKEERIACECCGASFSHFDLLLLHLATHKDIADYTAELFHKFTPEVIFPNGLVVSESVVARALAACYYQVPSKQ